MLVRLLRTLLGAATYVLQFFCVIFQPRILNAARRKLSAAAEISGLDHVPPIDPAEFGSFRGEMHGQTVIVLPDNHAMLMGLFHFTMPMTIENRRPKRGPDDGQTSFSTDGADFDAMFATRHASPAAAARIIADNSLRATILDFVLRWKWRIRLFSINHHNVTIIPRHDTVYPCTPADLVTKMLPDIAQLAAAVEACLAGESDRETPVKAEWFIKTPVDESGETTTHGEPRWSHS